MDKLEYTIANNIQISNLNSEIDSIWAELQKEDSSLKKEAESLGINIDSVKGKERTEFINLQREGAGLDPATTAIIVAFSPVAAKIVKDLWDHLILPKLKQSAGADALKEKDEKRLTK